MPAWDRFWDTVIEVIDPATGDILGRQRLSGYPHFFSNDGLVITHREGDSGIMVVDIWRPTLSQHKEEL